MNVLAYGTCMRIHVPLPVYVGLCLYGSQKTILGGFLSWVSFTLLF